MPNYETTRVFLHRNLIQSIRARNLPKAIADAAENDEPLMSAADICRCVEYGTVVEWPWNEVYRI